MNQIPQVSIILPTYNRAQFLPNALEAIRDQQFEDWELIIVDDGSSDHTQALVAEQTRRWEQPVRYIYQENQGAYGARNTGLKLAESKYVAFYDSDDVWLCHHLKNSVEVLESDPVIDWVYGACRMVEHESGHSIAASTFHVNGKPRPFLSLHARPVGRAKLFEDPRTLRCALLHGLYCGLQNSVIRRRVFHEAHFKTEPRNECEDQVFVVRSLAAGYRFAYLDDVHVVYIVHAQNSSAAGGSSDPVRTVRVMCELVTGYESLREQVQLAPADARALRQRLGRDYFWRLGYQLLQDPARQNEAFAAFERGLQLWPWDPWCWKTYVLARMRRVVTAKYFTFEGFHGE
ncbi:glycosyltransferase family 2 protein [Tautonia rosea]|uniref:glycosyltransferase family 2 protein n=1 Tax=Tautonia rosea TaxID=2728037 RepID=UPI00147456E0|nr:glycosyltransferase family A protein [Tautonia rosea]